MLVQVPADRVVEPLGAATSVPCSKITNDSKHHDLDGSSYQVTRSREGTDTMKLKGTEKLCDQSQCRYLDNYFSDWVNDHVFSHDYRRVANTVNTAVPQAGAVAAPLSALDVKNYIDKTTNPRAVEMVLRKLGFLSDLDSTGRRPYTRVCESVESWIKSGRFVPVFDATMPPAAADVNLTANNEIVRSAVAAVIEARRQLLAANINMNRGTPAAGVDNITGDVHVAGGAADALAGAPAGTTTWLDAANGWGETNITSDVFAAITVGGVGVANAANAADANINRIVSILLGNVLARYEQEVPAGRTAAGGGVVGPVNKNVVAVRPFVLAAIHELPASPQKDATLRACQLAALAVNRIINKVYPTVNLVSVGHGVGPGDAALGPNTYKGKINSVEWCTAFRNYSKFLEVLSRMVAHYNSIVRKAVIQAESVMTQFVNVNYLTMGRMPVVQTGGSGESVEHNTLVDEINAMRANAQLTLQTGGYKFPVETLKFKQENNCGNSEQESNNMVGGFHGMMAARQAQVALSCDRIKHMVKTHMSVLEGRGYVISNKKAVEDQMEDYSKQCKETNKLLENLQKLTRLVQSNKGPEDRNIDINDIEKLVKHYNTNAKAMIVSEDQIMALLQTMVQRVTESNKSDGDKQALPVLPRMVQ